MRYTVAANARGINGWVWVVVAVTAIALVVGVGLVVAHNRSVAPTDEDDGTGEAPVHSSAVVVDVTHPRKGAMERTTVQPGTIIAYQSADLYAEVSGYLKELKVDIGARVKAGQVLGKIDVPDLDKKVAHRGALLKKAKAQVEQMKARIKTAKAELATAQATEKQARAKHKAAQAAERFRKKVLARMERLVKLGSVEQELADEATEQYQAAMESTLAAEAFISTAKAMEAKADAAIDQAKADVLEAENEVEVAQAALEQAQVQLQFATLTSPYTGVVTQRTVFPGDFVRTATGSNSQLPLLNVQETDKVRVVVQVPDIDVPYTKPGDPAEVKIFALPGKKFHAKVSRIAASEDPETRNMRVEMDLPNPTGELRQGMYGKVKITLEQSNELLSIPVSCVVGEAKNGARSVFVVRDGKAHRVHVVLGTDNGIRIAVHRGLTTNDLVIRHPPADLTDGTPVTISHVAETASAKQAEK
jgi:HlyD family secretion protein